MGVIKIEQYIPKDNDEYISMFNTYEFRRILIKIGISADLQGFNLILKSIKFLKKQRLHTNLETLYEKLTKCSSYETSKSQVERAIRQAIVCGYSNNRIFKKIYTDRPKNKQFLYDLAFNTDIFKETIEKED